MESIFLFCCRSCLKGEGADDEYYTRLGLEGKDASTDTIKKAYKRKSLELHPDRLAQKGITVTPEHNLQFQGLKEAYDVLSDPKKRKMYDAIGANGIKLMDNPQDFNGSEFIKNFQNNRADRLKVAIFLAIICSIIIVMPILFCMKADGDMDNAPWLAVWTPIWCVDAIMLISSILFLIEKEEIPLTEDGDPAPEEPIPFTTKLMFFGKTVSIILIQVFVFTRLDHDSDWSWFVTFIPWFIFEGLVILDFFHRAISDVKPLDLSDSEFTAENDPHEFMVFRMEKEEAHFREEVEKVNAQKKVAKSVCRVWFAIFLALQLNDSVDWDWGLVMLPIWLLFLVDIVFARTMREWAEALLKDIDLEALQRGEVDDANEMMRAQHGQELQAASGSLCCVIFGPGLMAILLVSRLEASTFSTFIILIPVFIVLYCCVCIVGCGFCCMSNMSAEMFEDEEVGDSVTSSDDLMMQKREEGNGHSAEVPISYKPPAAVSNDNDIESNRIGDQYGTFTEPQGQQKSEEVLRSSDVDVDID